MNTIQLVGQAITSTNCTTPRLFNFNPAPVREAADVFLASGVNEIEVPEGVLDPEGRDIWSNKAEVGERLTGVHGVRIQARGKQASPQGYYALVFVFDEAPLADVPGDRLRAAIQAEGLPIGGAYGPVYRHMLYNMDSSMYRIAGGACAVAECAGTERAAVLGHQWLSADDRTLDTIGEVIAKVAENADTLRESAKS
jgi:hypothetical protein